MSKKYNSSIYLTIDSEIKQKFYEICENHYTIPSMVLRKWISDYVKEHGEDE